MFSTASDSRTISVMRLRTGCSVGEIELANALGLERDARDRARQDQRRSQRARARRARRRRPRRSPARCSKHARLGRQLPDRHGRGDHEALPQQRRHAMDDHAIGMASGFDLDGRSSRRWRPPSATALCRICRTSASAGRQPGSVGAHGSDSISTRAAGMAHHDHGIGRDLVGGEKLRQRPQREVEADDAADRTAAVCRRICRRRASGRSDTAR